MGQRVQGDPTQQVGRVVPLAEGCRGMRILVRGHREHEHGKGEDEFAELGFQFAFLFGGGAEG
jgi:hypothetical protein